MSKAKWVTSSVSALALSAGGLVALQQHEGTKNVAYLDTANVWTICTGSTANVRPGQRATTAECEARLRKDVLTAETAVKRHVKVPLTQGQYDALVSFTFNLGEGNLRSSTLLRKVNAGDCYGAGAQFDRWVYSGGRVTPGLQNRRADERAKWDAGCKAW